MNKWMPQWVMKRPMTHWVWAVMWLLGAGSPLSLLPQCILIGSAYPERRAWGRWAAVFAAVVYVGGAWLANEGVVLFFAVLSGALAWYGFRHERKVRPLSASATSTEDRPPRRLEKFAMKRLFLALAVPLILVTGALSWWYWPDIERAREVRRLTKLCEELEKDKMHVWRTYHGNDCDFYLYGRNK